MSFELYELCELLSVAKAKSDYSDSCETNGIDKVEATQFDPCHTVALG